MVAHIANIHLNGELHFNSIQGTMADIDRAVKDDSVDVIRLFI